MTGLRSQLGNGGLKLNPHCQISALNSSCHRKRMSTHDYDYSHKTEQEGMGMQMPAGGSLTCTTRSTWSMGKCGAMLLWVVSWKYQVTFPGLSKEDKVSSPVSKDTGETPLYVLSYLHIYSFIYCFCWSRVYCVGVQDTRRVLLPMKSRGPSLSHLDENDRLK